jgi:glycosyltransferase involved in cell wall biosynthesis
MVSSLNVGGMEQFVLRIARAQQRRGHLVLIVALKAGPLLQDAQRDGLPTCVLRSSNKIVRILRTLSLLARFRPDVINAHNQTSLHYATLGKRVGHPRVIMINHGQGLGSARTPDAAEWRRTDRIVAVSHDVAHRMDPDLTSKIVVIHNGVTPSAPVRNRAEVRRELDLPADRVVGLMVARIDGLKGHDTLLAAAARLRDAGVPITFLLAGDGGERANRERLAAELGLGTEWVRFLGFRSDIADLAAASDLFVLPSLTEGLPLSVLEAMSHRLPTVATAVGGIPELITSGENGLLVPVNDPQELADALARLVRDGELRRSFGGSAYRRVQQQFSFAEMVRQYEALYDQLLNREDTGLQIKREQA